ncbi:MAG: HD domain-containing protein [Lachnospiraceae bacterium]
MSERYEEALAYATKMHEGQKRKGGEPYIIHPVAVAEMLKSWGEGEDTQICGLFHDLLEDTDADPAMILRQGGPEVLHAVRLLTKTPGYVMETYAANLKKDPMARVVKAADRLHNLRSAPDTSVGFRVHYIKETLSYYMDLTPEMPAALEALIATLPEGTEKENLQKKLSGI